MRADRLLQIVGLLRQHGRLSASELARRLEVTPRTVLRDMEALSTAGVPVVAERGRQGGFRLLPGYRPAVEDLTAAEVQALLLAGQVPAESVGLAGPLASALRKLADSAPPEHGRSAARISDRVVVDAAGWWGESEQDAHFVTVQQAVLTDRRLRLTYRPRDPSGAGVRTVDPYGLVQAAGVWYLIAAHRGRPRSYRVSRVQAAAVLDDPSARPADLDLRALWRRLRAEFATPPSTTVRLRVDPARHELAMMMLAGQGAGRPRVVEGEAPVTVELEVQALRPTAGILASLGSSARVLGPPALLDELLRVAVELRATYGDAQPPATAGMIDTFAPSGTGASRPPENRTSSSPT